MKRIEYGSRKHTADYKLGKGFPRHIINSLDVKRLSMKFHPYNRKLKTSWEGRWCWIMSNTYTSRLIDKYVGRPYSELTSYLDKILKESKVPRHYNAEYFLHSHFIDSLGFCPYKESVFFINEGGVIEKTKGKRKRRRTMYRPWKRNFIVWNDSQRVRFPSKSSPYMQHRWYKDSMAWKMQKGEYKWYLGTFWCKIEEKFYKLPVYDVIGLFSYYTDLIPSSRFWWETPKEKSERIQQMEGLYIIPEIYTSKKDAFTNHIFKEVFDSESSKTVVKDFGVGEMYPVVLKKDYEVAKNKQNCK